jgi:hypothetical protein
MADPTHHFFGTKELRAYNKGHRLTLQKVPRREGLTYRARFGGSGRVPMIVVTGATVQAALDALETAIKAHAW